MADAIMWASLLLMTFFPPTLCITLMQIFRRRKFRGFAAAILLSGLHLLIAAAILISMFFLMAKAGPRDAVGAASLVVMLSLPATVALPLIITTAVNLNALKKKDARKSDGSEVKNISGF